MTGDRSWLKNFVKKFIWTVRFGNDHFGAIMGYGDYVIGNSVISRVYYVEGLGHNLFSVGQFCDSDLKVAHDEVLSYLLIVQGLKEQIMVVASSVKSLKLRVGIFHQKSVPRTPKQNGVVERRNRTLVEAARTMLIFSKAPMFLWAEAVAARLGERYEQYLAESVQLAGKKGSVYCPGARESGLYGMLANNIALFKWVFNSLVHSLCALSTLRRSGLRTASAAAKPCQGDSSEFYLITGSKSKRSTAAGKDTNFRNSDVCYHDPEKCVHAGPMVTTLHGANNTTRMIKRFTVADDLKESSKIIQGARPSPRLTPDAFEAKLEWCVLSRALFDGHIREPPRIPPHVNQHSRDNVPEDIYRHMAEQDRLLKEAQSKVASHDGFPHGGPKIFTTQANNSFFDGAQMTLTYPTSQDQPMSSSYPSSYPATSHIMTPMEQQGFVPWSSTYQATVDPKPGPSHNCDVGGVILDVMHREKRETRPSIFLQSPYMRLPDTTVAPKKQADNSRNTTRNAQVSAFNLGKADGDENARVEEVMITEACATENYISFEDYVDCMRFLYKPRPVFLDRHIRGFRVEE
ncbi:retrovirus-related pol polyprotein from transposon TNT 1-94 [Tanacetum coccineum]